MPTFSANLGFLWNDRPLPDAIRAASNAGFAAVECHWPYATPPAEVSAALSETGLSMLGLNTRRGDEGASGLAALPGRSVEAQLAIDEAVSYASIIGAKAIHVMAGATEPMPNAFLTFLGNLRYACRAAARHDITVLIEPLNLIDNPGYYLHSFDDAAGVIEAVERPNIALMFDCYHAAKSGESVVERLEQHIDIIGHIQFADTPNRTEPGTGDLDYGEIFATVDRLGWTGPLGAEYRPSGPSVEDSLGWMNDLA